ncbi:MAG: 4Fe-4S binding protein, partial [Acidobacteria bacterium]|nr:4Fe-4S binding protein [Acidobacteriota bacterium]
MAELASTARRLYRLLLGAPAAGRQEIDPGLATAATGEAAVATVEAALGALDSGAAETAGRHSLPRDLGVALGLASTGQRASCFLDAHAFAPHQQELTEAAARCLPLVLHLRCQAESGGSDHTGLHAAARQGALTLVAANAQEAVDFTVVARRVAETCLLPAVVAMDGPETAAALQEVVLPTPALLARTAGAAGDRIHSATPAQELLFGPHRRRVPRWHDLNRPMAQGIPFGEEALGPAAAGRRAYVEAPVAEALIAAFHELARRSGRSHQGVSRHRLEGARVVLVALGSAIEVAEAVADALAGELPVGVAGLRALSPLPESELVECLPRGSRILVLERLVTPLATEGPLTEALRAALGRTGGRDRKKGAPTIRSIFYGLGGLPLRSTDLAELCRRGQSEEVGTKESLFLGLDFAPRAAALPKRQAWLDGLRRDYPQITRLGLRASESSKGLDLRPASSLSLAAARRSATVHEGWLGEAGRLLHAVAGGHIRGRTAFPSSVRGPLATDHLIWSVSPLRHPGDRVPTDVLVWLSETPPSEHEGAALVRQIGPGGSLLLLEPRSWHSLPASIARAAGRISIYTLPRTGEGESKAPEEELLGALFGVLQATGRRQTQRSKLLEARRRLLDETDECPSPEHPGLRLALFEKGLDSVELRSPEGSTAVASLAGTGAVHVPERLRQLGGSGSLGLASFWDRVGILYRQDEEVELTPDPALALGVLPAASGVLRPSVQGSSDLPAFDPSACTGCGACWIACPEGAVLPAVATASAILELGMRRARDAGQGADALRRVSRRLATELEAELRKGAAGGAAGHLLEIAWGRTVAASPLPEPQRESIEAAFSAVREALAELPLCRTEPFFGDGAGKADAGREILSLAIDPDACTGCGLCVSACEPGALTAAEASAKALAAARAQVSILEEMPEPAPATLERARLHPVTSPLAVSLLPAAARAVLTRGASAESGSGEAVALRQILGSAAFHLGAVRRRLTEAVTEARSSLAVAIHQGLERALPDGDLVALAQGLDAVERPDSDLGDLTENMEKALSSGRVDVPRMRRLVAVARELADLALELEPEGRLGNAPFGVVVAAGAVSWTGSFPYNAFSVPVTFAPSGKIAAFARGVLGGQVRQTLEALRTLRRAQLELEGSAASLETAAALPSLRWQDLEDLERRLCPPLVVIAAEASLDDGSHGDLLSLLGEDLPIRVILLAEADLGLGTAAALDTARLALALPRPTVVQTSIAHPSHLEAGVAAAFTSPATALLRLHAPSPRRHGFATDQTLGR